MRRTLIAVIAVLLFGACVAEDAPYDDVASQEGAVTEVPAINLDQEDMRVVRDACDSICTINATICRDDCRRNAPADWCFSSCDPDACRGECERKYPELSADESSLLPPQDPAGCCRAAYRMCHRFQGSHRDGEVLCLVTLSNCLLTGNFGEQCDASGVPHLP